MDARCPILVLLGTNLLGPAFGWTVTTLEARITKIILKDVFPHRVGVIVRVAGLWVMSRAFTEATFLGCL